MLGLLEPTSGTVATLGMTAGEAVASGRIGSMLQATGLPTNVRVGELVEFARRLYPNPLSQAASSNGPGLTALTDRSADRLSGGESQRLRFAIGIAGDPDLVFLDEPTVAMDVETRRAFWADMRRRRRTAGRSCSRPTTWTRPTRSPIGSSSCDHGRIVADGTGRAIRGRIATRTIRFDLADADPARWPTCPA